ncbi:hypothetical protein TUM19329_10000 [Legionella antarctica]|uniref:Uncharacterized protein n=1 Tax=Legionella antarctica TaxID=2708020 RepID=A0A6F8T2I4_9GAMM|nr:hypothetical protein TUM19329_10000 [Legionella antarctica]
MKIITSIVFFISSLFINDLGYAFSCYDPQVIHQKPIQFNKERITLTRDYQLTHYGIDSKSIDIEPKMIVVHWTCIPSFDVTVIDKILSHINKKPGNQATVFNTLTIRGPPELVSLIKENRTG